MSTALRLWAVTNVCHNQEQHSRQVLGMVEMRGSTMGSVLVVEDDTAAAVQSYRSPLAYSLLLLLAWFTHLQMIEADCDVCARGTDCESSL